MFGEDRSNFSLSPFELLRIAEALSHQMQSFDHQDIEAAADAVLAEWLDELIENKIGAYREFRPLDVVVECALIAHRLPFKRVNYHQSLWHQKARADGKKINARAGTTTLYETEKSLIKTQSAYEAGSGHKKKELMARAMSVRYTATTGRVVPAGHRLILVLDGTFTDADLRQLTAAGWDDIFYPDEMDRLVKAIV